MHANLMLFAQAAVAEAPGLSFGGTVVMVLSIGAVLSLISFCLFRVMTLPPIEDDGED